VTVAAAGRRGRRRRWWWRRRRRRWKKKKMGRSKGKRGPHPTARGPPRERHPRQGQR
jgi:hypothetical protein